MSCVLLVDLFFFFPSSYFCHLDLIPGGGAGAWAGWGLLGSGVSVFTFSEVF